MNIVFVSGSPGNPSRVATLVDYLAARLAVEKVETELFAIEDFNSAALVYGQRQSPAIQRFLAAVAAADALVVATPVYQASFSGALKLLLDLIPQNGLRGKIVLPLAAGGSPGHLLALDYALKPVLAALGTDSLLAGVYASGEDLQRVGRGYEIQTATEQRLDDAADELLARLHTASSSRAFANAAGRPARPRLFADDGMRFVARKAHG